MLQDKFDKLYSSLRSRSKSQSFIRFLIRRLSNIVLPQYFKLVPHNIGYLSMERGNNVIVSLTTFPERIEKLWLVIECILRQDYLPNKIVLWLSEDQFPNKLNDLPEKLLKYNLNNLLDIRFVESDLRSHKKYYYSFKEFPNDVIITLDDDLFYSSNTVNDLIELHGRYPDSICCLRGYKVEKFQNRILPYSQWKKLTSFEGPSKSIFHTSGGGTLYKKSFFNDEVLNKEVFLNYCFYADDVWLNIMAQINKTSTVKGNYYSHLLPINNVSFKLSSHNVSGGGNDSQINSLINYYNLNQDEIFN